MWSLCGVIGVYWVSGDQDLIVVLETPRLIQEQVCLSLSVKPQIRQKGDFFLATCHLHLAVF